MEHEVVALEALRDSSVELIGFLEGISTKLDLMNEQAESMFTQLCDKALKTGNFSYLSE